MVQKEYKTRHNWVGKVTYWKLCKRLKFNHTSKWYMHKPESVLENGTHKILWDFEIQMDHPIPARRPYLVLIKREKKLSFGGYCYSSRPQSENVQKQKDKYLDSASKLEKQWNMKVTVIPIVVGALGTVSKGLTKRLKKLEIRGKIEII